MKPFPLRRWLLSIPLAVLTVTAPAAQETRTETAIFAGGCFWCMEYPFDKLDGVISTTAGYTGGHTENPTYKEVSRGGTGHAEATQVVYDPQRISYAQLLDVFWHNIDPTTSDGQFCDWGDQTAARSSITARSRSSWRNSQGQRWRN